MRIAIYQMNIVWEDKEKNYLLLEDALKKINNKGIELIVLPEMSFTGFSMNTDKTKEIDSQTINKISDFAKTYQIPI